MAPRTTALLLATLVSLPCTAASAQQDSAYREFVAPDSVRIRYVMRGSGPPLVLLHGFALSAAMNWIGPGAADSLAAAFTVIVPDLRGHGHSDKPHDVAKYGVHFVTDIVALLDHLGIPKAHVAGYSMGGMIALKLLTAHPERVRAAVLGGAGWPPPDAAPPPFLADWLANLDRAARGEITVTEALSLPGARPVRAAITAALDRNDPAALAAVLRGSAGLGVSENDVRAIRIPVHAVLGEMDQGARANVDALARRVPHLTVTILPGLDHRSAMADPRVAQAIRRFLRAV